MVNTIFLDIDGVLNFTGDKNLIENMIEINWQFYFNIINDKYIESTHSDTTFVLQKREFDSGDVAGLYDSYLIQYDGAFGNLEYEKPITYNVMPETYKFVLNDKGSENIE